MNLKGVVPVGGQLQLRQTAVKARQTRHFKHDIVKDYLKYPAAETAQTVGG
jgi:hypothetical protein